MKYNSNIKQFLCDDSILESLLKTDDKEDIINEICHLSTKEMELLASEIPHHLNYLEVTYVVVFIFFIELQSCFV